MIEPLRVSQENMAKKAKDSMISLSQWPESSLEGGKYSIDKQPKEKRITKTTSSIGAVEKKTEAK